MKINAFIITKMQGEAFGWALGLYGLATGMRVVDGWIADADDPTAGVVSALQDLPSATPVQIAEEIIGVGAALVMWGILERCFIREKRTMHLALLGVVMVLSLLRMLVGLPMWDALGADFLLFAARFINYATTAVSISTVLLGAITAWTYAGKLRAYGASLVVVPVLMGGLSLLNYYLYNVAAGLTLPEIATYVNMGSVAGAVLAVLPMVLLRRALVVD